MFEIFKKAHYILKKTMWIFVLIFFSVSCLAEEKLWVQKAYPPYPDVWGYDLSEYPAIKWGRGSINAYRMADGDIWFLVDYSYKVVDPMEVPEKHTEQKYVLIKFFKGEIAELNAEEREQLNHLTKGKNIIKGDESIRFRDGSSLKKGYGAATNLRAVPDFVLGYFVKFVPGEEKKKYSILAAYPNVVMRKEQVNRDLHGAPFLYQKLFLLKKLVDLGDDTFLIFSDDSNLILRFDKNLNTQFKSVNILNMPGIDIPHNFFVIDYSLIEDLEHKFMNEEVPLYQTVHDELLSCLSEQFMGKVGYSHRSFSL